MLDMAIQLDITWRDLGECAESGLDFFDLGSPARQERLMAHCAECSVRHECLEYAVHTNQEAGVWGGMLPDPRRKYRRVVADRLRRERRAAEE